MKMIKLTDAREHAPMTLNKDGIDAVFTPPVALKSQFLTANSVIKMGENAIIAEETVEEVTLLINGGVTR